MPAISRCAQSNFLVNRDRKQAAEMAPPSGHQCWPCRQGALQQVPGNRPTAACARRGRWLLAGIQQVARQAVLVGEQAGGDAAQRDDAGAGQRGDVDQRFGIETLGVGQCIAQDQATFGVGIEDFDGLAGQGGDDVARSVALPPGMFSVAGTITVRLIGRAMRATACMVPSTLAAPHMSYFISSISAPGFSEMPPVSKVTPLPTRTTGFSLALAPVAEHDQLGRLVRATGDGEQRVHAELVHVFALEDFAIQLEGGGHPLACSAR